MRWSENLEALLASDEPLVLELGEMRTKSKHGDFYEKPRYHIRLRGTPIEGWFAVPVCQMARELVQAGFSECRPTLVSREGVTVFHACPLGRWAGLTVTESDTVSARFEPFKAWEGAV